MIGRSVALWRSGQNYGSDPAAFNGAALAERVLGEEVRPGYR